MFRTVIVGTALLVNLVTPFVVAAAPAIEQAQPAQLTAADGAAFVGEWSLALEGPNGAQQVALVVKTENDKVAGEITFPGLATQPISDITKADKTLVLRYAFDYQGNAVDAVVSLTPAPAPEGKMAAQLDFAGGAYTMAGSATRKETAK